MKTPTLILFFSFSLNLCSQTISERSEIFEKFIVEALELAQDRRLENFEVIVTDNLHRGKPEKYIFNLIADSVFQITWTKGKLVENFNYQLPTKNELIYFESDCVFHCSPYDTIGVEQSYVKFRSSRKYIDVWNVRGSEQKITFSCLYRDSFKTPNTAKPVNDTLSYPRDSIEIVNTLVNCLDEDICDQLEFDSLHESILDFEFHKSWDQRMSDNFYLKELSRSTKIKRNQNGCFTSIEIICFSEGEQYLNQTALFNY